MEKRQETAMGGKPVTLLGKKLNVGDKAPDFVALKQDLTLFTLKEVSEKIKIVSAVPSVDTSVCELQTKRTYGRSRRRVLGYEYEVRIEKILSSLNSSKIGRASCRERV